MGVRLVAPQDRVHFVSHIYSDTFFDYINQSARASAKPFVSLLFPLLKPTTVIDLGSGRGVWMDEWRKGGADRVFSSAAVTGQGGEFHVNQQPLSFWQDLFAAKCCVVYDCVLTALKDNKDIAPWYRYNAIARAMVHALRARRAKTLARGAI